MRLGVLAFLCGEGRMKNYRDVSSKLIFYDVVQDGEKLQVVVNWGRIGGENDEFHRLSMLTRVGDIIS
jgi:lysyl-tRNA synthetase class 2